MALNITHMQILNFDEAVGQVDLSMDHISLDKVFDLFVDIELEDIFILRVLVVDEDLRDLLVFRYFFRVGLQLV